ncbi:MAG: PorT family protein, partial [Chitinophagaceae bacterium]|nr:PorT family protein [Chitinophagaceae bacterium]
LFISHTLMAQFHIGIKAGANITRIEGKSFADEFKYGYHVGGFAEIGLGRNFSLQPEVLYNQYSTTIDSSFSHVYQGVVNSPQRSVKLNYLSLPILLNYKIVGPLSIQAGPQFGVLIDQSQTVLQNGGEAFKNGDFSMLAGAVVKLNNLRVTGRYAVGLNNINDIDDQNKWKNQTIQLSLGVAF